MQKHELKLVLTKIFVAKCKLPFTSVDITKVRKASDLALHYPSSSSLSASKICLFPRSTTSKSCIAVLKGPFHKNQFSCLSNFSFAFIHFVNFSLQQFVTKRVSVDVSQKAAPSSYSFSVPYFFLSHVKFSVPSQTHFISLQ